MSKAPASKALCAKTQNQVFGSEPHGLFLDQAVALINVIRMELKKPIASPETTLLNLIALLDINVNQSPLRNHALERRIPANSRIGRLLVKIHNDPFGNWTVDRLSQEFGQSRTSFSNTFCQTLGVTPKKYVRQLRIDLAKGMLQNSDLPISKIAFKIGYADTNAFSRAFKRQVGQAPGAFRRQSLDI